MEDREKLKKFERLAENRMNELIKKMRLVGNLANKNNYDYTEEHANVILNTIEKEYKDLKKKFTDETRDKDTRFSFRNL